MNAPDPNETRRKRLLFRSRHRGTKEMDILLGGFAEANLARFSAEELDQFERLLEVADDDLYGWVMGRQPVPEASGSLVLKAFTESVRFRGGSQSN